MVYDKPLAIELASAYLRAFRKIDTEPSLVPVDFFYPIIEESWSKEGREFVFVGFKNELEKSGGIAVFEVCEPLIGLRLIHVGSSPNIDLDVHEFKTQSKNEYERVCRTKK